MEIVELARRKKKQKNKPKKNYILLILAITNLLHAYRLLESGKRLSSVAVVKGERGLEPVFRAIELIQYLSPVGFGPSVNTCPK